MPSVAAEPISPELLRRFDVSGPRYTSYPTADRVVEAFSPEEYRIALAQRASGATHPYVIGKAAVQRFLTVAEECALAGV